jgi:hypothetical protein
VDSKFIKQNGEHANTDAENTDTVHSHFTKVFDRSDIPVNLSIPDEIESLLRDEEARNRLESSPDKDEVLKVIKKMKNGKAGSITGVTPYMLKILPPTSADYLTQVIRGVRLLLALNKNNVDEKFTNTGCIEAIHCLRSALGLRRIHGMETFVLFVDLVKAFDTINHTILFRILRKYGIPEHLINMIERMYKECKVQVKVGK